MLNESSPISVPESEDQIVEPKRLNLGLAIAICCSGFVLPGLGHMLMGRWIRGAILALAIGLMFLIGLSMQGELYVSDLSQTPLRLFGFFADVGVGLMYWLAEHARLGAGNMSARTYDYGTTYLWVCGLLNYLTILDAFDIARGRKP
jgi:hypothetical protein